MPAYAGLMLFFMAFMLLRAGLDRLDKLFQKKPPTEVSVTPLRGEGLVAPAEAAARADAARANDPRHPADFPGLPFGGTHLPLSALHTHFLIQGTTQLSCCPYQQIPWDLGLIRNYATGPSPSPSPSPTAPIRRIRSYNYPRYLRHQGFRARIDENVSPSCTT